MMKKILIAAAFLMLIIPGGAYAEYTADSREFRETAGQLNMDGHSEHDISTCQVKKSYHSEIIGMLNEGMAPDDIISYYTDIFGPSALKAPDKKGGGLLAWLMPAAGLLAGGGAAALAIRNIVSRREGGSAAPLEEPAADYASFEKVFEAQRKNYF